MSCDVDEATERLENELCYDYNYELCSFSNLSVASSTSQLILQPFPRCIYVTSHSPTLPLLHLCHSSFSNPSFASPTSQDFHLRHLASRPWCRPHVIYFALYLWIVWHYWLASRYTFLLEVRVTVVNLGITVLTCGHIYDSSGVQLYPTVVFVQVYFFNCISVFY